MKTRRRITTFENAGYYFIGLFALAILGFWPSYFSRFFDGSADFSFYFHFHATIAVLWIFMLIAQPVLIRKKKMQLHRTVGKLSYILVPLIYISVILLAHSRITGEEQNLGLSLWFPFKDLLIFAVAYGVAIKHRHNMPVHARGMVLAGIVLIEPALARLIQNVFIPGDELAPVGYLATTVLIWLLLIFLIIRERKEKKGRWVFPLGLGMYLFVHSFILLQIPMGPWQAFARWFASLPLT